MSDILRKASIAQGLEPPENECFLTCKVESPSLHELELSARKHRWPEMRKLQVKWFGAFLKKVTEYEVDVLKLLKLPNIDKVRESSLEGSDDEGDGTFTINSEQFKRLRSIKKEWLASIIGTKNVKDVEENESVYAYYLLAAYSLGLEYAYQDAKRRLPAELPIEQYLGRRPMPDLTSSIISRVHKQGNKRIIKRFAEDFGALEKELRKLDRSAGPMKVARYLHKQVGEQKAWWWQRLARSESTLANNAAFLESAKMYQVPFVEWSASSTACEICIAFDGNVWEVGKSPLPVESSHPYCLCVLRTVYIPEGRIQDEWDRPTPYDSAYTRDEIAEIAERLNL